MRFAKLTLFAAAVAGLLGIGAGATGCTTNAFCFENCSSEASTLGSGGASSATGLGGFVGSGGTGGCLLGCSTTGGAGGCIPTNGGIEICDKIDNNCDGEVDNIPGLDLNDPHTCGTCDNDCFTILLNNDPATITCTPSPKPGMMPGTCKGKCAQDYYDLDNDGTCEYYCLSTGKAEDFCNGLDDDCDGKTDEDVNLCTSIVDCGKCGHNCVVLHGTPECVNDGNMPCDQGNTQCKIKSCDCNGPGDCWWDLDGNPANGCEYQCDLTDGGAGLGVEVCGDGVDNDCDGKIDEADDLSGDPKIGAQCFGSLVGECGALAHAGMTGCVAHQYVCQGANVLFPNQAPEVCNSKDDDCDGTADDNLTDTGMACGISNIFPCSFGSKQCVNGALQCVGAINPGVEVCNGIDDDCDGNIDKTGNNPPGDSVGPCNVPPPPPAGATSPCKAGAKACIGGTVQCVGSVGPTSPNDGCGDDSNCDGVLTNQPDLNNDVHNCGQCGNDCYAGAVHSTWACQAGMCKFQGCLPGYWDNGGPGDAVAGDHKCGYACNFVSAQESCNGADDNCDGQIDENLIIPSPVQVCGVTPGANTPECTAGPGGISVACVAGAWKCTFPAGVCNPTCATAMEICDTLDNNCNGLVNENVPNYGQPCASDDAAPGTQGVCRTVGTFVCNGNNATKCSATINLALAGPELCDGLDNDCDGAIDEPYISKGSNPMYFVQPAVTKIGASTWIYSYEASRPSSTAQVAGTGNGYYCTAGIGCINLPPAPPNTPLDKTPSCSAPSKIPWFNVTPTEAEQACSFQGGHVCSLADWQTACQATIPCTWGYNPRGAACTSALTGSKFCNLGPFDFDSVAAGDQDGLLPTASNKLQQCFADWSGLQGNTAATNKIFDITGNLREITKGVGNPVPYVMMGGAFNTADPNGATCGFTFYQSTDLLIKFYDLGFRCCFPTDPTK